MTDTYVLGIDFGTESCRAALFDLNGEPKGFAATPYATSHPRPGWAEQSPADWWDALGASSRAVLAASGVAPLGPAIDALERAILRRRRQVVSPWWVAGVLPFRGIAQRVIDLALRHGVEQAVEIARTERAAFTTDQPPRSRTIERSA